MNEPRDSGVDAVRGEVKPRVHQHEDACSFWTQFAHGQVELLKRAIDENKWYLSQRAGHDVGSPVAEADFVRNHADRVAGEFRQEFCRERCPGRALCRICAVVDDLNRYWAGVSPERKTHAGAPSAACLPLAPPPAVHPDAAPAPVVAAPASDPGKTAEQPPQVSPAQA